MPPKSTRRRSTSNAGSLRGPIAILFLLFVTAIYLFQQYQQGKLPIEPGTTPMEITRSLPALSSAEPGGSLIVYFSDPLANRDSGGPETGLVEAINGAQKTIDVAIYNISLPNVTQALIAAHRRGVIVRMVMESEAMDGRSAQQLDAAGITIIGDGREGLMHNKFIIIDSQEVWTGSTNLTSTAAYNDFNNLVRLRSTRAAQNYAVEFNEFFIESLFGPSGKENTPYPQVTIDGVPVEIYFSPDDGVADEIIAEINAASTSIDFLAYAFTSDPIANAMRDRAAAGVRVRGVFDESQVVSNTGGEFEAFERDGFDVKIDGISGLMHHKVIVIDGRTVITGSYNFSANAENNNDENILILHSTEIAGQYLQEFERVYGVAKD